jgi:acetyl esterase/lipase
MASPQLQTVIQGFKVMGEKMAQAGGDLKAMRAVMEEMSTFPSANETKCTPVNAGGVPAEWIVAPGAADDRVLLYLHGGGYVMGSINTHREMVARLSKSSGARALVLDYRLAPENPCPAAVDDATAAYRWLLSQGIKSSRIVIAGDSAGGGLTLATLVALRDAKVPLPAAGVCISPWTDMEGSGASMTTRAKVDPLVQKDMLVNMAKLYLGGNDPKSPLAAPLYADMRGLPPLLIHVGDAEVLLDDSTRVAERAKAVGVKVNLEIWPEMPHVWHLFAPMLPEGQQAIEKIGQFVREQTA